MGKETKISWCDHTFNLWEGCEKISPACDHCYAARRDQRLHGGRHWAGERRMHEGKYWHQLFQWHEQAAAARQMRSVFVGSLMDIFEQPTNAGMNRARGDLWNLLPKLPWLQFLLTTKRPEHAPQVLPSAWRDHPPRNLMVIVTVEHQEYLTARLSHPWLLASNIPIGLSAEPLLGPLDLDPWTSRGRIAWVIAGGESGPHARITEQPWIASLCEQAQAHDIPFHFKQWGEWAPVEEYPAAGWADSEARRQRWQELRLQRHQTAKGSPAIAQRGSGKYARWGLRAAGRAIGGREWLDVPAWWQPQASPFLVL